MIFSPARAIANKANALKSTGPRTAEGKAISRCNALKHGLAGEGVALTEDDAAEVARRSADLLGQFRPATPMGQILVHRIALTSLRLERSADREAAHLGAKIRHAREDHDLERQAEVAGLLDELDDNPATAVRRLLRTPEGTEALIAAWLDLKDDLGRYQSNPRFWTAAHCQRANHLSGRRMDEVPVSRINELSNAIWGDFGLLRPGEGKGLDEEARQAWARERLVELVDEEVAALRDCYETLDHEAFDLDRDEAPRRALFDPSKEATLARRYEAAAERGMFRALRELRKVEAEAAENPPASQPYHAGPLASSGNAPQARPGPTSRPEDRPADAPSSRAGSLPRLPRVEPLGEMGNPVDREAGSPRTAPSR